MVTTKNLWLKPVCVDDVDIYSQILGSDELTKYLPKGELYTGDEIRLHVQNRITHWSNGFGSYVIHLRSNPAIKIGYVGIEQCEDPIHSDIRYALLPVYQGCGYVYEAAKVVLAETFKANKHSKIYGVALKENIPSLIIIKKLGMTLESEVKLYDGVEGLETYSIEKFV
ncbi:MULTISPECIES: GNAT family N-acetyltransferase [unclassified Vibrio]|uniref:GNAT family N-acetyltransferase n=1 Tax=unclassified Vibrio TaxID=2614977 RepID=UPI000B8E4CED|nr:MULTISPECIES: GNAT family N-acetyltransferase [unclassified Vibrio]NAW88940.1 GNAT family N-acetyltransferase [Vibrio sp. V24_P1S3T111]OXX25240.1 GNAT family N-acetyltransferase [Vibrio sp. V05_P4A8T149]OXX30397.1 GNAT family N-acetyltransferase [Vibrio sp. V04_P4A5T148]OXX31295.1 GNAT family N-acetyltransferase [Vibrio sp. V14_P6S14T42]OXX51491.1 GNAT family N-acetyltransferase [Vibrio sp. V18_P1S4T112]